MRFKEFMIQEVGTSTGDVAGFRRISIPMTRRMWPPEVTTMFEDDPPPKSKKKTKVKMQPQVKENLNMMFKEVAVKKGFQ